MAKEREGEMKEKERGRRRGGKKKIYNTKAISQLALFAPRIAINARLARAVILAAVCSPLIKRVSITP